MCQAPLTLADGQMIACRKCWQCVERKIDDWVGRNIAESKFSAASHFMTLTYGRDENGCEDHPNAKWLTYSDVQKLLKRLRDHLSYQPRYFCAGEYGAENGRAHWHVLFYWRGEAPGFTDDDMYKNYQWKFWRHGHVNIKPIHLKSARYVCKYMQKGASDEAQSKLSMSKKPLLGAAYLTDKARRLVEQRLAPRDPWYSFADVTRKDNNGRQRPVRFRLANAALDFFMNEYVRQWREAYPGVQSPYTEFFELWLDKQHKAAADEIRAALAAQQRQSPRVSRLVDIDDWQFAFEKERGDGTPEQQDEQEYIEWRREVGRQDAFERDLASSGRTFNDHVAFKAATNAEVASKGD